MKKLNAILKIAAASFDFARDVAEAYGGVYLAGRVERLIKIGAWYTGKESVDPEKVKLILCELEKQAHLSSALKETKFQPGGIVPGGDIEYVVNKAL